MSQEELRRADAEARRAAQRVFDRPVVLEAGAGTGKTSALVARLVCWSVGAGWDKAVRELDAASRADRIAERVLERIVAITFTDAAAAEMAARVARAFAALARGELAEAIDPDSLLGPAAVWQPRAHALLLAVDRLRVSTIHALCNRLLAANPVEAGLHPAFAIDADGARVEEIVRAAVAARLRSDAHGPEDDDIVTLAGAGIGPDRIARVLAALVEQGVPTAALAGDPFAPERVAPLAAACGERVAALAALAGGRFATLKRAKLARDLADALQALNAAFKTLAGSSPGSGLQEARRAGGAPNNSGAPGAPQAGVTLGDLKGLLAEHLSANLCKHLAKWSAADFGAEERAAAGDIAAELAAAARELAAVCAHIERADGAILGAACRVLAPLLAEVRRTMRDVGVVTYTDLLVRCRDLLIEHPEVAARERRALDQLVVDEFQDTDALQCEIVAALALTGPAGERPGLFLVGDPKQSIYGWRNADLAAYEAFVERVLAAGGVRHALCVNYRSVPPILEEVERCLAGVMARDPGYQPAFEPLLAREELQGEAGFTRGGRAAVEHWIIDEEAGPATDSPGDGPLGAAELEARAVAADIAELHEREGVAWSDVAILMRATGDLPTYLQALRDAGVPYAVERDKTYYQRREILEATALVRAVLDPADHVALLAWLRSASVGVPDAAWLPLWSHKFPALATELAGPEGDTLPRLRAAIAAAAAATPPAPGLERIAGWERSLDEAMTLLAHARATFATRPAAEFVELLRTGALLEATEAARVLGAYRLANLDRFFRALLDALEESGAHPQVVLERLRRALRERPEAEEARLRDAAVDAVRVLTVHKAKGLTFSHVYLVQAGRGMPNEGAKEAAAVRLDGAWELSLFRQPTPGWWAAAARTRRIAEAELVRTLYVAMTRPRVRLVVSGEWPALAAGERRKAPSHLALLARRRGGLPDIEALAAAARQGSRRSLVFGGASWRVPPAAAAPEHRQAAPAATLAGTADVSAQAATLARLAAEAASHMQRPWSAPASAEAHRLFAEAGDEAESPPRRRPGSKATRDVATAAGTLVHRFLERLDLAGDIAAQLAAAPATLARHAATLADSPDSAAVVGRAAAIIAAFAASPLATRLAAIAPHVVSRELPILVPPSGGPDPERGEQVNGRGAGNAAAAIAPPVSFISGAIDLVYRDTRSGELVIADYKTDDVASAADIDAKIRIYRPQAAVYRHALASALALPRPPRFELWFLAAGRLAAVS